MSWLLSLVLLMAIHSAEGTECNGALSYSSSACLAPNFVSNQSKNGAMALSIVSPNNRHGGFTRVVLEQAPPVLGYLAVFHVPKSFYEMQCYYFQHKYPDATSFVGNTLNANKMWYSLTIPPSIETLGDIMARYTSTCPAATKMAEFMSCATKENIIIEINDFNMLVQGKEWIKSSDIFPCVDSPYKNAKKCPTEERTMFMTYSMARDYNLIAP